MSLLHPFWGERKKLEVGCRRSLLLVAASLLPSLLFSQETLSYRDRGDRREGVLPKPVSGYDLELLGAMLESSVSQDGELPGELAVRFYLDRSEDVYVTLRERRPRKFYWLDDVRPAEPWRAKRGNTFKWSTAEVLAPLGLSPADLVGLVRLGRDTPSHEERVAPILLGGAIEVAPELAYRFTFKTNGPARIRYDVFAPGSGEPLESGPHRRRNAGQPFDLRWQAGSRPEGPYRLRLEGYFLTDNAPIEQVVEFFHTPSWPR